MKTLEELYPEYLDKNGRLHVEFCISNDEMYRDYKRGIMYDEEEGLHEVCGGQYIFKEYLDCERMWNEEIPCENYDYLKSIGACVSMVTHENCFSWQPNCDEDYEQELERFNDIYGTELKSLEEVFYYALNDDEERFNGEGLHMSMNLVLYGEAL